MLAPYSGAHVSTANLVAHGQAVGEVADVRDDADEATGGAELLDGRGDDVERLGVECAEAFVEEDRLELGRVLR
jgi:hypothetical protein